MKWYIHASCGNSPKNQMLIDWMKAFIEENEELSFITNESEIVFQGNTLLLESFEIPTGIKEIHIDTAITHGRDGAVIGKVVSDNNTYPLALFFDFSLGKQPKIKKVTTIVEST